MAGGRLLSIGALSRLTGVNIKSLRYYEEVGVLKPEYVNPSSRFRYYSYQQTTLVMAIRLCLALGIPLREFKKYSDGEHLRYEDLVREGRAQAQKKFEDIQRALLNLDQAMEEIELAKVHGPGQFYFRTLGEKSVLLKQVDPKTDRRYYSGLGTFS